MDSPRGRIYLMETGLHGELLAANRCRFGHRGANQEADAPGDPPHFVPGEPNDEIPHDTTHQGGQDPDDEAAGPVLLRLPVLLRTGHGSRSCDVEGTNLFGLRSARGEGGHTESPRWAGVMQGTRST